MICKHCNTENDEGAFFCSSCGNRLDGKQPCLYCGTINEENVDYCVNCGELLPNKNICSDCGKVFEGKFCPSCGKSTEPSPKKQPSENRKKIFLLVGSIAAVAAAFFSLLFTFFIGCEVSMSVGGSSMQIGALIPGTTTDFNLYYFFGKAYSEVGNLLDQFSAYGLEVNSFSNFTLHLYPIFGTIVSAAVLVAVVVLSIITILRFINFLRFKTNNNVGAFACATYFTYLAGALLLRGLYGVFVKMTYSFSGISITASATTAFNGATLAGLIVGGIFVGIYLVFTVLARGRETLQKNSLSNLIPTVCGFVCLILIAVFAGMAACGIKITEDNDTTLKMGFADVCQGLGNMFLGEEYNGQGNLVFACSLLAAIVCIVLFVILVISLVSRLKNFDSPHKAGLGTAITTFILTIAYLVFTIIATNEFFTLLFDINVEEGFRFLYTPTIVMLVFGTLNLVAAITHNTLSKKIKK